MTLVAAAPLAAASAVSAPERQSSSAQWRSPERDLWVGTDDSGSYLGMIERDGAAYLATDGAGRQIGRFWALADAEQTLVGLGEESRVDPVEAHRTRLAIGVAGIAGLAALGMVALGMTTLPF